MAEKKLTKPAEKVTEEGELYALWVLRDIEKEIHLPRGPSFHGRLMGQHKNRFMDPRSMEENR